MKKTLLILSALCTAMFGASATELSIQPAVEIVVSLKKNDDEILLENKNPDKNNPDGQ